MKTKPKYNLWQNVWFMLRAAAKKQPVLLFLIPLAALLSVAANLAQLYIAPIVLEKVENQSPLGELLLTIGLFTLVLVGLNGLIGYVRANTDNMRDNVRIGLSYDITSKACTTSFPNIHDSAVRRLMNEAGENTGHTNVPPSLLFSTMQEILTNTLGFILYLLVLRDLPPVLLLVVVATTAAGFFLTNYINGWGSRHREESSALNNEFVYITSNAIRKTVRAKDIRIFGLTTWLHDLYDRTRAANEAFVARREGVYAWATVVDVILLLCRNGIAYLYLINMALNNGLSVSEFLLYFTAFTGFSQWVTSLLQECSDLNENSRGIAPVHEYLTYPEQFSFEGGESVPAADSFELRLENVSFHYPGTDKDIIHNMDLTIRPGEKLAIVGLNGAGKTTLVKLLCGFYDPTGGRVLLNGKDIRDFDRREYYKQFSAVFQQMSVLDITVRENVTQDLTEWDEEKVKDCIEKAGLTEKIRSLPKGLDTPVGRNVYMDGVEFSGGETQRLMLARALYKDGGILVLDEPTAALDPIAENDIYQKYNEMTRGKTSLFISHRLASTRFCDRIIFLKDGAIAEEGTHDELLKKNGGYAGLFEIQARYYQEGKEF